MAKKPPTPTKKVPPKLSELHLNVDKKHYGSLDRPGSSQSGYGKSLGCINIGKSFDTADRDRKISESSHHHSNPIPAPKLTFFPITMLIIYTLVGAIVFNEIEMPYEQYLLSEKHDYLVEAHRNTQMKLVDIVNKYCQVDKKQTHKEVEVDAKNCENWIGRALFDHEKNMGVMYDTPPQWNYGSSVFFCASLYTTIGYGNIACKTDLGRIFTMIYALIGIPLMLTVVNNFGQRVDYTLQTVRRAVMIRLTGNADTYSRFLPLLFALVTLITILFGCSAMLAWLPQHTNAGGARLTFFQAFYFAFLSITTIGLGDLMPEISLALMAIVPILFGLCLFPMIINAINDKYNSQLDSAAGLIPNLQKKFNESIRAHSPMPPGTSPLAGIGEEGSGAESEQPTRDSPDLQADIDETKDAKEEKK